MLVYMVVTSPILFRFTWYDVIYWMCLRHWKGQWITMSDLGNQLCKGPLGPIAGGWSVGSLQKHSDRLHLQVSEVQSEMMTGRSQLEHAVLELKQKSCRRSYN